MMHFLARGGERIVPGFQLWKHIAENNILPFPRADFWQPQFLFQTVLYFRGNNVGTYFNIQTYQRRTKKVGVGGRQILWNSYVSSYKLQQSEPPGCIKWELVIDYLSWKRGFTLGETDNKLLIVKWWYYRINMSLQWEITPALRE